MNRDTRDLYLFTNEYPYGKGETFIENELLVLSEQFQQIYIFPLKSNGLPRSLPVPSIRVVELFKDEKINKWKLLLSHLSLILNTLLYEFKHLPFSKFRKSVVSLKSILLANVNRAMALENHMKGKPVHSVFFYSFWTDDWATVLSILKTRKKISSFISRVHGYDLYEERWPNNLIPLRNFQLKNVSRIYAASKDGLNYLQKKYPEDQGKFLLKHLLVSDNGIGPFYEDDELVIVSCSSIHKLKRVCLIPEILKQLKFKVKWIHFGDGPDLADLHKQIKLLPENIVVELKGYVENKQLIEFYKHQKVNLFIHLSETEGGVPLVLQEAASFGIPLLGAGVGGVVEIVTEQTGYLVKADFELSEIVKIIDEFRHCDRNTQGFHNDVRQFWMENFSSGKDRLQLSEM